MKQFPRAPVVGRNLLNESAAMEAFGSSTICVLIVSRAHRAPECRLKAGYNDVKVRRSIGTRKLSDGDAVSLGKAGVSVTPSSSPSLLNPS